MPPSKSTSTIRFTIDHRPPPISSLRRRPAVLKPDRFKYRRDLAIVSFEDQTSNDLINQTPKIFRPRSPTPSQELSFCAIEPYPVPEPPSIHLLEPLIVPDKRTKRKHKLTPSEQHKITRMMIGYTLAFFLLAIVTFYVVYFV